MFDKALDITLNQTWVYAQIRLMWALIPISRLPQVLIEHSNKILHVFGRCIIFRSIPPFVSFWAYHALFARCIFAHHAFVSTSLWQTIALRISK